MEEREESAVGVGMGTATGGNEDPYVAVDVAEISSLDDDVAIGHGSARNDHRLRRLGRTASGSSFSGPKAEMAHSKSFTTLSLLRQVGLQRGSSPSLHPSQTCDAGGSTLNEALTGGDSQPVGSDNGVFQRPPTSTEEASSSRWRYVRDLSAVQGSATNAIAAAKRLFNSNSLSRHGSFHRLSGDVLVIRRVGDTQAVSHTPGDELMTDCDSKPLPAASLHVHVQETAPMASGDVGDEEGGRPPMSSVNEEEATLSEATRSADGISLEKSEGKSGKLDGGNKQKLTDSEGKEVEEQEIPVEEAVCRICHSELNEGGEAFKLECACRGDLALAHKDCAVKWFRLKGTSTCEVCKNDVKNLVVELQRRQNPNDTMEDDVVTRQRARVEVSGLMLTSMPAYFCYFERLVSQASKDRNIPLLISLPLGCLVGIASTMVAQSAAPSHMWAYAGLQFLLIVACTIVLNDRTDLNASVVVMLGSLAGMGVAFFLRCVGKEIYFFSRGRPPVRETREEAPQTASESSDREAITAEPVETRPTPPPAGRVRWNGLTRGSREILPSIHQQGNEEDMRPAPTTIPSNSQSSRTGGQSEGQQLQSSYGPFPEGLHWIDSPMLIPDEERAIRTR